ncbi:hypothetical protein RRG08_040087 [Elysia crispata]|uniref:Uncharacterized protein n=1 Tax=Elysia crispata TaxID=231223 RepID=A0AAE0XW13_9GAST|nr:hypothetical protein RRG08_040087 [Elysia crispata]
MFLLQPSHQAMHAARGHAHRDLDCLDTGTPSASNVKSQPRLSRDVHQTPGLQAVTPNGENQSFLPQRVLLKRQGEPCLLSELCLANSFVCWLPDCEVH